VSLTQAEAALTTLRAQSLPRQTIALQEDTVSSISMKRHMIEFG
jgi:hypothetical protein